MTSASPYSDRLAALRARLTSENLDGFIVPLTDEHMSEYVGLYARRLEWLTGFSGSAGTAVILADKAALFVDGRYTLQAREQVNAADYLFCPVPAEPLAAWVGANAPANARIGVDPWLATQNFLTAMSEALAATDGAVVPVATNPVDALWTDRPLPSPAAVVVHPVIHAGRDAADKRAELAEKLRDKGADALVLGALDDIAWTFNIRGDDVPRTPVVRAFALLHADASAILFVDPAKLSPAVVKHLGPDVETRPYDAFAAALDGLAGKSVWVDPMSSVAAMHQRLEQAGARIVAARSPVVLAKAVKNTTELQGARNAHLRDGVAVTRFLQWLDAHALDGGVDELGAEARLEEFRRESGQLRDLSFDSISGFGPHGAIVHYRALPETNLPFAADNLYLIDSGGQYVDGTTDITRTIAIGTPTPEMRDRFTRVLKGHIALGTARFPAGTRGGQLDILARQYLWAAGLDYAHGTGHGVGSFLAVHEGPQRIATTSGPQDEPLQPGMIVSNEPGYYQTDAYGIRIENLVAVREDPRAGDTRPMLAFETLTLAPIDLRLVDPTLMTAAEIDWLDSYHRKVREALSPFLNQSERRLLAVQTAPLAAHVQQAA